MLIQSQMSLKTNKIDIWTGDFCLNYMCVSAYLCILHFYLSTNISVTLEATNHL